MMVFIVNRRRKYEMECSNCGALAVEESVDGFGCYSEQCPEGCPNEEDFSNKDLTPAEEPV